MTDDRPVHLHMTPPPGGRADVPAGAPPLLAAVTADRRRRGPYTAAGSLVRAVAADAVARVPELVARHDVELLTVAPELAGAIECRRETLTSSSSPEERTRFYPRARSRRVAHGLVEFLDAYVASLGGARTVLVEGIGQADGTDAEWLAILLRRSDPARLCVVLAGGIDDPRSELGLAIDRHTLPVAFTAALTEPDETDSTWALADRYVGGDCTSDDPRFVAAYEAATETVRAALHDLRAAELEALDEQSLRLGAIPFHHERGSDPQGAGVASLLAAVEHGVLMGFYESVIELGRRCLALLDWDLRPEECWLVVAKVATAMTSLDRADEAADLYDEACASSTLPSVHLQAAYGRAMLFTRFYEDGRLDHQRAKAWINTAIAISLLLPEGERRAFNLTFNENGLALIEMHLGDVEESLRLVTAGLDRLDAEAGPDRQSLHRSVLRYNRAQLLNRLGRVGDAFDEYSRVIDADPNHSEYYFERAAVLRNLGRLDEAVADYETAIRLSPPYPEPHFNLADLAAELGDHTRALAALGYVLELEPDFVDAHLARADIAYQLGDIERATADVEVGLAVAPDHPQLLCLAGVLALEDGRADDARRAFDAALLVDDSLVEAWANRAVLAFESGDAEGALGDLSAALAIEDTPDLRMNRALAYEAVGRLADAERDQQEARRLAASSR
jgi:tetratricopeptide (TPR) repeat protein